MMYHRKGITYSNEVRASLDDVRISPKNAGILAPVLFRRSLDIKYDITDYMKRHWKETYKRRQHPSQSSFLTGR